MKIATMKSLSSESASSFLTFEAFILLFMLPFCFSFPYKNRTMLASLEDT